LSECLDHPHETAQNKRVAQTILDQLARERFGLADTYEDHLHDDPEDLDIIEPQEYVSNVSRRIATKIVRVSHVWCVIDQVPASRSSDRVPSRSKQSTWRNVVHPEYTSLTKHRASLSPSACVVCLSLQRWREETTSCSLAHTETCTAGLHDPADEPAARSIDRGRERGAEGHSPTTSQQSKEMRVNQRACTRSHIRTSHPSLVFSSRRDDAPERNQVDQSDRSINEGMQQELSCTLSIQGRSAAGQRMLVVFGLWALWRAWLWLV